MIIWSILRLSNSAKKLIENLFSLLVISQNINKLYFWYFVIFHHFSMSFVAKHDDKITHANLHISIVLKRVESKNLTPFK
jgi:hypothetical protein